MSKWTSKRRKINFRIMIPAGIIVALTVIFLPIVAFGLTLLGALICVPLLISMYAARREKTRNDKARMASIATADGHKAGVCTVPPSSDSSVEFVPSTSNEAAESLMTLAGLRGENLITVEEYLAKRKAILDRL
ncbi:MAG: hypothetical protein M3O21_02595 [Chloroflexota bacterium]|nr:hypothetical protein [Chloroflexota bacterium]